MFSVSVETKKFLESIGIDTKTMREAVNPIIVETDVGTEKQGERMPEISKRKRRQKYDPGDLIEDKPKYMRHYFKPWQDPDSLFCSPKLKEIIGKEPLKGDECRDAPREI